MLNTVPIKYVLVLLVMLAKEMTSLVSSSPGRGMKMRESSFVRSGYLG